MFKRICRLFSISKEKIKKTKTNVSNGVKKTRNEIKTKVTNTTNKLSEKITTSAVKTAVKETSEKVSKAIKKVDIRKWLVYVPFIVMVINDLIWRSSSTGSVTIINNIK